MFFFMLFGLVTSQPSYAIQLEQPLQITPQVLYAEEETDVQAYAKPHLVHPKGLFLIEVDDQGKRIRDFGVLTDFGALGDSKKEDGVYSRKFKIVEKSLKTIHLSIAAPGEDFAKYPVLLDLVVIRRPSFLEVLKQVWQKIKNHG